MYTVGLLLFLIRTLRNYQGGRAEKCPMKGHLRPLEAEPRLVNMCRNWSQSRSVLVISNL